MYVDIVILANLASRPQHGYEIKKTVGMVLGAEHALNNGVLYPTLRRFEEMGAVEREVERQPGKPDRHIYHLTQLGREILHDLICEFPPEVARDQIEFIVRVSFFELVEPSERREILAARAAALGQSLETHERIVRLVAEERMPMPGYARQVLSFLADQVRLEREWIERLTRESAQAREEGSS